MSQTHTPSSQPSRGPVLPLRGSFRFNQPLPNRGILLRGYNAGDGTIMVRVTNTDANATNYFIRIGNFAANLTLDANINLAAPPATHILLANMGGNVFGKNDVAVTGIPATAPRANNYRIAIGAYDNTGKLLDAAAFAFIAIPAATPVSVSVPGKGCVFFAYTAFGAALPNASESLAFNLPAFVPAPIDATSVAVSVPQVNNVDQEWINEHQLCTANGQGGDNDVAVDAYKSAVLGSQNMKRLNVAGEAEVGTFLDGLLCGMWDFGAENSAASQACVQLSLGIGPTTLAMPKVMLPPVSTAASGEQASPLHLLMALHMDNDWNQALDRPSGKLDVRLTWS